MLVFQNNPEWQNSSFPVGILDSTLPLFFRRRNVVTLGVSGEQVLDLILTPKCIYLTVTSVCKKGRFIPDSSFVKTNSARKVRLNENRLKSQNTADFFENCGHLAPCRIEPIGTCFFFAFRQVFFSS